MPSVKHKIATKTAARMAARKGGAAAAVEKPARDLDDAATQAAIRDPQPDQLTLGGKPIEIYPLPALWSRKFVKIFARIYNAATGIAAPMTIRAGIALDDDDALSADFFRFVARAEHPPDDEVSEDALLSRAQELLALPFLFDERGAVLDRICDQNRMTEILQGPKQRPS